MSVPVLGRFTTALMALALVATGVMRTEPVGAQSADHDRAYQVVRQLFDAMRARDTIAMRSAFVANASMQTIGTTGVSFASIDGWIASVGRASPGLLLDERLANPVVQVDGVLASVWVEYWFFAGDRFSHCGVDAFQLVRQADGWKVFSLVDTRRSEGCAPPPGTANTPTI